MTIGPIFSSRCELLPFSIFYFPPLAALEAQDIANQKVCFIGNYAFTVNESRKQITGVIICSNLRCCSCFFMSLYIYIFFFFYLLLCLFRLVYASTWNALSQLFNQQAKSIFEKFLYLAFFRLTQCWPWYVLFADCRKTLPCLSASSYQNLEPPKKINCHEKN